MFFAKGIENALRILFIVAGMGTGFGISTILGMFMGFSMWMLVFPFVGAVVGVCYWKKILE